MEKSSTPTKTIISLLLVVAFIIVVVLVTRNTPVREMRQDNLQTYPAGDPVLESIDAESAADEALLVPGDEQASADIEAELSGL